MNKIVALISGLLFGSGLLISGMTDTAKVQGWLDILGDWDITLAFVMGGAMIPMFIAWQLTKKRAPVIGGVFPERPVQRLDKRLILGSIMFGMGWGLSGLCPGPALASATFGGPTLLVFLVALVAGMLFAPNLHKIISSFEKDYCEK